MGAMSQKITRKMTQINWVSQKWVTRIFMVIKSHIEKKISDMGWVVNFDHYGPTRAPPGTLPKIFW